MKHIFVYSDKGVNQPLVRRLLAQLSSRYSCLPITAKEIIEPGRLEKADLLIIPGGRDLPYVELLQPDGTDRIREYVSGGGRFLGICAGAYFGSSYVEFDKGGPLHVEGERRLQFFRGKTIGPLFGTFDYESDKGAKIVPIVYQDEREQFLSHSYYNGGCSFEPFDDSVHTVLATYAHGAAAMVRCTVGKGLVVLSGVHFEKPLKEKNKEEQRVRLMSTIIQQFETHSVL